MGKQARRMPAKPPATPRKGAPAKSKSTRTKPHDALREGYHQVEQPD